jgi:hypothetical protein
LFDGTFPGSEFNVPVSGLIGFDTEILENAFIPRGDTSLDIFAGSRVDIGLVDDNSNGLLPPVGGLLRAGQGMCARPVPHSQRGRWRGAGGGYLIG